MAKKGRTPRAGALVIIGGAEDRTGDREILSAFVQLAGGRRARLVVATVASEAPDEIAAIYQAAFKQLGVRDVMLLHVDARADADAPAALAAVRRATGVFFTGGNQLRITRMLGGTKLDTLLHRRHGTGLVLGGTSAGAAMMSSIMIVGGPPVTSLRAGMVELGPGLEFLRGVLIDQHFEERGRLRRLLAAITQYPHELGLGVDENTAAIVRGNQLEVVGAGAVTIVDAGTLTYTNLNDIGRRELLAVSGVQLHVLPAGYRFDLTARAPVLDGAGADKKM